MFGWSALNNLQCYILYLIIYWYSLQIIWTNNTLNLSCLSSPRTHHLRETITERSLMKILNQIPVNLEESAPTLSTTEIWNHCLSDKLVIYHLRNDPRNEMEWRSALFVHRPLTLKQLEDPIYMTDLFRRCLKISDQRKWICEYNIIFTRRWNDKDFEEKQYLLDGNSTQPNYMLVDQKNQSVKVTKSRITRQYHPFNLFWKKGLSNDSCPHPVSSPLKRASNFFF